jgi:hypothetical protein
MWIHSIAVLLILSGLTLAGAQGPAAPGRAEILRGEYGR